MKKLLAMFLTVSLLLSLALCGASADDGWADYTCVEQNFSTKIPLSGTSGYDDNNKGLTIYTDVPGYIPFVIVSRRPMDKKFSNPTNYLNNVYREYIEDKYGDDCLGMNPAKDWEVGGKTLLGARYMYKIGEYTVVQIVLIDVRDAGDVEYTAKFIEGEDAATMAALEEAVRYYQETDAAPVAEPASSAGSETASAPSFLTPAEFVNKFNTLMSVLADQFAEELGEEGVQIVNENYTLVQTDPQGPIVYYGNADWSLETGFMFADEADALDSAPAKLMNFNIKNGTPDGAVELATYAFRMIIAYEYQDEVSLDDLTAWFKSVNDPANIFPLPGYTLNYMSSDEYTQYAVLPSGN